MTLCRRLNNTSRSSLGICCIVMNSENCVFRLEINENFFFFSRKNISVHLHKFNISGFNGSIPLFKTVNNLFLIKRILFRIIITMISVPPQHPVLYGSAES